LKDTEAMKRALALIESKMGPAKIWLRDPNGLPGNITTSIIAHCHLSGVEEVMSGMDFLCQTSFLSGILTFIAQIASFFGNFMTSYVIANIYALIKPI